MLNFELYRIFKIVAEEKNFTKASERLFISQPAVSKHIKNLEKSLGVKLFLRTPHGIELTECGDLLLQKITKPIEELNNAECLFKQNKNINISLHAGMYKMLSKQFAQFNLKNQDISLNFLDVGLENMLAPDINEMLQRLENQKVDLVISKNLFCYNNPKIEFVGLGEINDKLFVNKSSKYLNYKTIGTQVLKNALLYLPKANSVSEQNFLKCSQLEKIDYVKNVTYSVMLDNLCYTDAIALISKEYCQKELQAGEIVELETSFKIAPLEYGIYVNKNNKTIHLTKLVKFLKNSVIT